MADRGLTASIPIWVRAPGIIALVLIGVVAGTMLAGAIGVGGGQGPDKHGPVQRYDQEQQKDPGDHRPPTGGH